MTVDLDSGSGLMDRLGSLNKLRLLMSTRFANEGGGASFDGYLNAAIDTYASATLAVMEAVDGLTEKYDIAEQSMQPFLSALRQAGHDTLVQMVREDNPQPSLTVEDAIAELIVQMEANSETVDALEPSVAEVADSGNAGDGVIVASVLSGEGKRLENAYAEDILCDIDSVGTAGNETWTCRGEVASPSKFDFNWPDFGSGATAQLTTINAADDPILTNGDFEDFTANAPDSWTIDTGSAGTDIDDSTTALRGSKSLAFVGDSSTLSAISQDITADVPSSRVPMALNVFLQFDTTPAAGELIIDLYDGSGIINDDEGTANSLTIDLTAVGTSWEAHNTYFRLPDPVPATVTLRYRLSTAITTSSTLLADQLCLAEATRLYSGGPYLCAFAGGTDFGKDDRFVVTVTNNPIGTVQEMFNWFFDMDQMDKILPSVTGGTETIADSVAE